MEDSITIPNFKRGRKRTEIADGTTTSLLSKWIYTVKIAFNRIKLFDVTEILQEERAPKQLLYVIGDKYKNFETKMPSNGTSHGRNQL